MQSVTIMLRPLHISACDARLLLERQGPSLALWRAAEIAALREQMYEPPILDLGCGDGLVTAVALRGERLAFGVDPDAQALAHARQTGAYQRFIATPMEDVSADELPPNSIGTVVSNSVVEHLANLDATLAAVTQALRPGGRLIFTTPGESFSQWLAAPVASYARWRNRRLVHRNIESLEAWRDRLALAGLTLETARPYLRHSLVTLWDALELSQQVWIGKRRVVSLLWRRLPPQTLDRVAQWLAATDLSAAYRGGGRLYVARKPG